LHTDFSFKKPPCYTAFILCNRAAVIYKLQIEISVKLSRVRDLGKLETFLSLVCNKVLDKLLGEYAACCQVVVICLQSVKSRIKSCGKRGKLCLSSSESV